jgi:ribosomal protein S21
MIEINIPQVNDPKQQAILFDKAVKKLKKLVEKEGFVKEYQDRRYYQKPSDIERKKQRERERNNGH